MILLQSTSRYLLQILSTRVHNLEKGVELDCQWVEFDDVRYHIQANVKNPNLLFLSVSIPTPPPETIFVNGLPPGAIEAIKATYGVVLQILDPPRDGFNLTVKLNLSKLPADEEHKQALLVKISSIREVVLGAPLRAILKQFFSRTARSDLNQLVTLVHRPNEAFFVFPRAEKVTLIFPMHFRDSIDTVLAASFLQEFVEARRTPGLSNAPPCLWSPSPPLELQGACSEALSANAGFVSFVIFPRHVEGRKMDRTVWSLLTFHAYVSYHVKCSEGFMHTRMRRRVESLIEVRFMQLGQLVVVPTNVDYLAALCAYENLPNIEESDHISFALALDRAKPDSEEKAKRTAQTRSFKRLSLKDGRGSFKSN